MTTRHIPQHFIQDLLHQVNLVDLVEKRIHLKKAGSRFVARCPFHHEKTASFTVDPNKQFYYCFGCQVHGNAISFLMAYERLEFVDAIENIANSLGVPIPSENTLESPSYEDLYQLMEKAVIFYQKSLFRSTEACQYLKTRGISESLAKKFGLGFAPDSWDFLTKKISKQPELFPKMKEVGMLCEKNDHLGHYYDRFRKRLLFPIHNRRGRVIGFGGRSIDQQMPKYLNSPETPIFHKGQELYGLNLIKKTNRILVVEGYMDVITLHQHGFPFAVAPLGTAITRKQIQMLLRYTSEIIFCFDADSAGKKAAWRALETLLPLMKDGIHACFLTLPNNEDPDSFLQKKGVHVFENILQKALPLSDFFFKTLSQPHDLNTIHGRTQFAKSVKQYLDHMPNGLFKQFMLNKLADIIHLSPEQLDIPSPTAPNQLSVPITLKRSHLKPYITNKKAPSIMRTTIALLLHYPSLIEHISDIDIITNLQTPGIHLFKKMIDIIQNNSNLSTGILLEFFRENPKEQKQLAKLASIPLFISKEEIKDEFLDSIKRLKKQAIQETINQLQAKLHELSYSEKEMLQRLIAYKISH